MPNFRTEADPQLILLWTPHRPRRPRLTGRTQSARGLLASDAPRRWNARDHRHQRARGDRGTLRFDQAARPPVCCSGDCFPRCWTPGHRSRPGGAAPGRGGTPADATQNSSRMQAITQGRNSAFTPPALDFGATAAGIDVRSGGRHRHPSACGRLTWARLGWWGTGRRPRGVRRSGWRGRRGRCRRSRREPGGSG